MGGSHKEYVNCHPGKGRKEHIRFGEPTPATDHDNAPLLASYDPEAVRKYRGYESIYSRKSGRASKSLSLF